MGDTFKSTNDEILLKETQLTNFHNGNKKFDSYFLLAVILKYKYFLLVVGVLSIVISSILAFRMPNWYTATVNAVPPQSTGSMLENALGNINSTLKSFGLTKLSGNTNSDNYSFLVILQSWKLKDSIIKKYKIAEEYGMTNSKPDEIRGTFSDNVEILYDPEGNYTISIQDKNPEKAAMMANDYIDIANSIAQKLFNNEAVVNTQYLDERLKNVENNLRLITDSLQAYSSKKMLFSPEAQASAISSSLSELKTELFKQELALQMIQRRYGENDPYTTAQKQLVNDLKIKIQTAETQPGFGGNFALKNATEVGIEYMRLYTEYETNSKVKAFLLPMIEESKLNEFRQMRSLIVLDKAIPPQIKTRPKRSVIVLGSFVGTFVLSFLLIIGTYTFKNARDRYRLLIKTNTKSV